MKKAFTLAARRGVDVRIITPGIPDKKFVYQATRSYYNRLVKKGVRIFEYTEYVPYENVVEEYTDEVIKKMAEEELQKYLNELEKKGVQIISNSVTISLDADGGHVKGTLILDGPIGKEVPISSEHMASTRHNE